MIRPQPVQIRGDWVGFPIESNEGTEGTATWVLVGHANKIREGVYSLHFLSSNYGRNGYYSLWNGAFVPIDTTGQIV